MRIYTKTGDDGKTDLIGDRRNKDDIRVESYGTLDELNSFLQLSLTWMPENLSKMRNDFNEISYLLFDCQSDLAITKPCMEYKIKDGDVSWLESRIDEYSDKVKALKSFILPGGCSLSGIVHVCRTITRRAERRIVTLKNKEEINNTVLLFINRLSDFFFIAARVINTDLGFADVEYKKSK